MRTTPSGKARLVIVVSHELPNDPYAYGSYRYGHLRGRVMWQCEDGTITELGIGAAPYMPEFGDGFALSQTVAVTVSGDREPDTYAPQATYAPYRVDGFNADRMAKTLAKIARGLDRAEREQGHAANFAQYVSRVTRIIGAKAILTQDMGSGEWHSPTRVDSLETRCQRWIDDIAKSVRPAA